MQVDPRVPMHINTKECMLGMARHHQRDMAVQSALALRQQFTVHGDVLERVKVFRYLGRLLSHDDDNIQAVRSQLCKARGTWARVEQVLPPPRVSAKFYKAIVQSVLLYRSKTWVLSPAYLGQTRGVPHPRGVPDGEGACASAGAASAVGLPILRGGPGGVWDAHN
jgi:hypothetical protein